jgi:purine-binding chemotaxis protein CheW
MEALDEVVEEPPAYVSMPLAPAAMLGVAPLRGTALPVMDAAGLLNWSGQGNNAGNRRVAVVRINGARVGVRFDQTREVLRVSEGQIQWLDGENEERKAVSGVILAQGGNRLIQILDIPVVVHLAGIPRWNNTAAPSQIAVTRARRREKRLVSFRAGSTILGIDSMSVQRVILAGEGREAKLLNSPMANEICRQMIMVGQTAVPVIQLREFLGWGAAQEPAAQVLICRSPSGLLAGFAIDALEQLVPYQPDEVRAVPIFSEVQNGLIRGCFLQENRNPLIVLHEIDFFSAPAVTATIQGHAVIGAGARESARDEKTQGKKVDLLVFRIGGLFAMRMSEVREVLDARQDYVRLPQEPPEVLGTFGLRGEPVPVVDPRKLFDLEGDPDTGEGRLLIFQCGAKLIGMRVDSVESILHWTPGDEELPNLLFQEAKQRMGAGFERGMRLADSEGRKQPMVLLHARQVIERLRAALGQTLETRAAA